MGDDYYEELARDYRRRRDILCAGLVKAGFKCRPPQGAYYVMADFSALSNLPDDEFAKWLRTFIGGTSAAVSIPGDNNLPLSIRVVGRKSRFASWVLERYTDLHERRYGRRAPAG